MREQVARGCRDGDVLWTVFDKSRGCVPGERHQLVALATSERLRPNYEGFHGGRLFIMTSDSETRVR